MAKLQESKNEMLDEIDAFDLSTAGQKKSTPSKDILTQAKANIGRPAKKEGQVLTKKVQLYFTESEMEKITKAANDVALNKFLRKKLKEISVI